MGSQRVNRRNDVTKKKSCTYLTGEKKVKIRFFLCLSKRGITEWLRKKRRKKGPNKGYEKVKSNDKTESRWRGKT